MTWYLVMAGLFIGPFEEHACKQASYYVPPAMCKQADYLYACDVDGKPGTYTTCPHFTYPQVTIK